MPRFQRPRREVPPVVIVGARPFLRYSRTRDAYVLKLIGDRHGPVLKPKDATREHAAGR